MADPKILTIHKDRVVAHRSQRFITLTNAIGQIQPEPGDIITISKTNAIGDVKIHTYVMVTDDQHEYIYEEVLPTP